MPDKLSIVTFTQAQDGARITISTAQGFTSTVRTNGFGILASTW